MRGKDSKGSSKRLRHSYKKKILVTILSAMFLSGCGYGTINAGSAPSFEITPRLSKSGLVTWFDGVSEQEAEVTISDPIEFSKFEDNLNTPEINSVLVGNKNIFYISGVRNNIHYIFALQESPSDSWYPSKYRAVDIYGSESEPENILKKYAAFDYKYISNIINVDSLEDDELKNAIYDLNSDPVYEYSINGNDNPFGYNIKVSELDKLQDVFEAVVYYPTDVKDTSHSGITDWFKKRYDEENKTIEAVKKLTEYVPLQDTSTLMCVQITSQSDISCIRPVQALDQNGDPILFSGAYYDGAGYYLGKNWYGFVIPNGLDDFSIRVGDALFLNK